MRMILCLLLLFPSIAMAESFDAWKERFARYALDQGLDPRTVDVFMRDGQFLPRVIDLDRKQPEKKKTFVEYYKNVVNDQRIGHGRRMMKENNIYLARVEAKYGVPAQIIAALWGIESNFGDNQGDWGVLSTLGTLAYEGRRADFFRGELIKAMRILEQGDILPSRFRGSWAGAMGQCQFMPSSYLMYAVDGDGDGKRDIWNNRADVFASAANYLMQSGWQSDLPWGTRAELKHPIAEAFVGLDEDQGRTIDSWARVGVHPDKFRFNVRPSEKIWLVAPDGLGGPTYLVTRNYKVIMKWNRSTYFATSVGRLSDELKPGFYSYEEAPDGDNFNE